MAIVFTRKVKHPGTEAQPFLIPALEVGRAVLKSEIAKVLRTTTNLRSLPGRLDKACKIAAAATKESAKDLAPVDTARLSNSINIRRRAIMNYTIGTNVEYAAAVEFGTKAHPIVPVTAKVLRFVVASNAT